MADKKSIFLAGFSINHPAIGTMETEPASARSEDAMHSAKSKRISRTTPAILGENMAMELMDHLQVIDVVSF